MDEYVTTLAIGRRRATLDVEFVRDATAEDVSRLNAPAGVRPAPIAELRHRHHSLAKMLADGLPEAECALISGYSSSRISILKADPMFRELIAYYATKKEAIYSEVHRQLASLGAEAVEVLRDKLEKHWDPEARPEDKPSTGQVIKMAEMALDRSIAPSKAAGATASVEIKFVTPAAPAGTTIEGEIIDVTPEER